MFSLIATIQISRWARSAYMSTPSSKFRLNPVLPADNDGVAGLDALQALLPARSLQSGPGLVVDENKITAEAALGQLAELRLQVLLAAV